LLKLFKKKFFGGWPVGGDVVWDKDKDFKIDKEKR